MENRDTLFALSIDPVTKSYLSDTARWARFLALIGMLFLVLIIVANLFGMSYLNSYFRVLGAPEVDQDFTTGMRIGMIAASVIMVAIMFFPLYYLLHFANRMKTALTANDQEALNLSFLNLKRCLRYVGILVIAVLAMYALIFVIFFMTTLSR